MPCYHPLKGFRKASGGITWTPSEGYVDLPMEVPCGQCVGCRLERSRQWAARIMHECAMHDDNAFLTLTYDDAHLPKDLSLDKSHFRGFIKRLRARHNGRISYFHCGEYGEENGRPHYHAILFGIGFPDKYLYSTNGRGDKIYCSSFLSSVWRYGNAMIGNVTFESAAYCARYCLKKVTGDAADEHYRRVTEDGEVVWLEPEYASMSLRPAIGKTWFQLYGDDVIGRDSIVVAGREARVPRYYDKLRVEEELKPQKFNRKLKALEHKSDQTPERLAVREEVKLAATKQLKRSL